jgi:hypothetical protein
VYIIPEQTNSPHNHFDFLLSKKEWKEVNKQKLAVAPWLSPWIGSPNPSSN